MPKMKPVVYCFFSIADMTRLKHGTDINMLCCTHKPTMLDFLDRAAQAQLGRRRERSGEIVDASVGYAEEHRDRIKALSFVDDLRRSRTRQ